MNENPTPTLKGYIAFSITKCPTDKCSDCVGSYTNRIIGIRIVCYCPCGHNNQNSGEVQTN